MRSLLRSLQSEAFARHSTLNCFEMCKVLCTARSCYQTSGQTPAWLGSALTSVPDVADLDFEHLYTMVLADSCSP